MSDLYRFLTGKGKALLFHPRKKMLATFAAMLCMMVMMPLSARAQGHDYSQDYLTFDVITSGTILWKQIGSEARTISYSTDNGTTWTDITSTTAGAAINVTAGDHVLFKGTSQSYAVDRSNYSGFDGGTATYGISGNIMSLIYGDDFVGKKTMSGTFNFCSIFKQSKAVSAENLVLPATTLTNYCYRAMFSKAHDMAAAPALPATTLAQGCYWYMFEECPITTAPELNATTLVKECYGNMFTGCTTLNYIKCLATTKSATDCLKNWVYNVSPTGTFVKEENISWSTGASAIPSGWAVVEEGTPTIPTISCDGFEIELSCTTTGAVIYYRLDNSGSYTQYTGPITMTGETFIECYSENENGRRSDTISQTCVYDDRTIYEYSNQSLDSWTYGGNTITTPYSVNAIDGHSSSYAKGTFTFETDVNLRSQQPTYLWFQHADQSASIYVDNILVEKHWGGYNAFFVDISNYVHKGTNHIKVALKNNEGNYLAPAAGDFNFNATLGKVKLFTSPCLPEMSYGYDGFHITSTVDSTKATINVKTTIPTGASVVCTITGTNCNYTSQPTNSTGEEMTFTTTITNPRLWHGTIDPYLYNVKLEIYHDGELYHSYERPYGLRFYKYIINDTEIYGTESNPYTGFLLNGQPYLLRGCCMHDDIAGKANALNDADYTQTFAIIQELGNNFLRLAHYPHPKEVYDWCDQLGIIVQTEVPCVNKMQSTMPTDYYTHLEGQYRDMVNQHYNHPCIMFWGLSNETTTDDKAFAKEKIEGYSSIIKSLDPYRWVGYVLNQSNGMNPSGYYNDPSNIDWFGCNIYVGWYDSPNTNTPINQLNTRINNTINRIHKPVAYSEYGCGGTQHCHSDDFMETTTRGNNPRHDIEYMMWLHEGHIATIKNYPQLLSTSQWQLFDIAVYNRQEGYKVSLDGETVFDNDELKYLNNKGLVERDHVTKKDPFYLYKAWWNTKDKFVHICGKDYLKTEDRIIKCYTNDGDVLTLSIDGNPVATVAVTDNIAQFPARNFSDGDVITVSGATTNDTFTIHNYDGENVFITEGDWNTASNWSGSAVPDDGSNVVIAANATIPSNYVAHAGAIKIIPNETLAIADGGQLLHSNSGVTATVEKSISAYTVPSGQGLTDGWYFIASPLNEAYTPTTDNMLSNTYDLYRLDNTTWENFRNQNDHPDFTTLNNGAGYLYANSNKVTLQFTGALKPYTASENVSVSAGWNLVGNPFAYNVYASQPYYKMNNAKTGIEAVDSYTTTVIAPCTGIIINAAEAGNVTFSREAPVASSVNNGGVNIALSQLVPEPVEGPDRNQVGFNSVESSISTGSTTLALDNAIVSFNEGSVLPKFRFGNNAEIYLPQGNEDYAIAFSDKQGEMPLNFKAKENGSYTLTVNPENVEMAYLHLIDNMTGEDVDLLHPNTLIAGEDPQSLMPTYTFQAKTTDYESRFRLVFSVNETDGPSTGSGTFAFISNGNIIITDVADACDASLQVIDMTGRVIVSRSGHIQCVPTSGMTPGVYVLRLINGNDVKTQKIVVR